MNISAEVFFEVLGLVLGFSTLWVIMTSRVTKIETRVEHLEKSMEEIWQNFGKKLDKLFDEITELKIMMGNKTKDK